MIRRLQKDELVEFDPPTLVSVAFVDDVYTFSDVTKIIKVADGSLYLEFQDTTFTEIRPLYKFYKIGAEID